MPEFVAKKKSELELQAATLAQTAYIVWLTDGSCDGCTTAVMSASEPGLEDLIFGNVPDAPTVTVIHPTFMLESGADYRVWLDVAARGELRPFVLVIEGVLTVPRSDARHAAAASLSAEPTPVEWLSRLAPHASAIVALGSCAAWGGLLAPPSLNSGQVHFGVTQQGVNEWLGKDYQSRSALPVINVPGCAPPGAFLLETLTYIFLHLAEMVPLKLDAQNRPAWLFNRETYPLPPRTTYPPALGLPLHERPQVDCAVPLKGWQNELGGCTRNGGGCIACIEPDFADRYVALARPDGKA